MSSGVISELSVSFVHPDGRKVAGRIWIGRPEVVDDIESRCENDDPVDLRAYFGSLVERGPSAR